MEAEAENRRVTFRRPGTTEETAGQSDNLSALGQNYLYDLLMTPSDKRISVTRKVAETTAIQAQGREEQLAQEKAQITWSRQRGFGRTMDRSDKTDAEVLTREERIVHTELTKVLPKEAQLFGVHIADDTSKIHAQAVVRDQAEANRLFLATRTFEAQTGRVLDLELLTSRPTSQPPRPGATADLSEIERRRTQEELPPQDAKERHAGPIAPQHPVAENHGSDLVKRLSTPREPIAEMIAAATLAAFKPNQQPLQPLVSAGRNELGVPLGGTKKLEKQIQVEGQQGGSLSSRRTPSRRRRETEEDEGQAIFSKERSDAKAREALREADELLRQQSEDQGQGQQQQRHQQEEGGKQRRQSSACPSCGTALPESQAGSCPVCAQSGPNVMALARIHYRAAGAKFLATVDAFTATDEARTLILTGATTQVASLRYEQEIVGHKDFLKFKVKP